MAIILLFYCRHSDYMEINYSDDTAKRKLIFFLLMEKKSKKLLTELTTNATACNSLCALKY